MGVVSQVLQFPVSYDVDNDSHGILRNRCIFPCPCFQAGVSIDDKNWLPIFPIIHHDIANEILVHAQRLQYLAFAKHIDRDVKRTNPDMNFFSGNSQLAKSNWADDVASLEWLSHIVDDSFSKHFAAAYRTGMLSEKPKLPGSNLPKLETPVTTCFKTIVPSKARSKRGRSGGRVWSLVTSPRAESPSSSTSSSSSSPWFVYSSSIPSSTYEPLLL
ncbi:GATA transcription factor 5-like [Hibiscus syriacus]|uniref:GATA transcription factor 5-like n=1 Tax=Hibiscus syriacus TaxID=106335 RepID=UPI001920E606|nr:GATA transcription factor 5-like [Hibiscus syriacus]